MRPSKAPSPLTSLIAKQKKNSSATNSALLRPPEVTPALLNVSIWFSAFSD
jgi:hypothetical protein